MGIILNLNVCKETGICVLDITYIIATYEITQVFILEIHGGRLNKRLVWYISSYASCMSFFVRVF